MVKAEITVGTCYGDAIIPVEVVRVGSRPGTVWVQALNGLHPFTRISHGGPYQDSMALVLIPSLRNLHINGGREGWSDEALVELGIQPPQPFAPPILPPDWFLESAYEDCTACDQA